MAFHASVRGSGKHSDREFTIVISDINHPIVKKIICVSYEGGEWDARLITCGDYFTHNDLLLYDRYAETPPVFTIEHLCESEIIADFVAPLWTIAEITHMQFDTPIGIFNIRKLMLNSAKYQQRMLGLYT